MKRLALPLQVTQMNDSESLLASWQSNLLLSCDANFKERLKNVRWIVRIFVDDEAYSNEKAFDIIPHEEKHLDSQFPCVLHMLIKPLNYGRSILSQNRIALFMTFHVDSIYSILCSYVLSWLTCEA